MPLKPHTTQSSDDEPSCYFTWERQRRRALDEPGKDTVSDDLSKLPPLPSSSPWGAGPGPGDEPLVDRREDADTTGVPIDQQQ
jgi:hypothetical protein